jgi:hypothetical protein
MGFDDDLKGLQTPNRCDMQFRPRNADEEAGKR